MERHALAPLRALESDVWHELWLFSHFVPLAARGGVSKARALVELDVGGAAY